MSYFYSLRIGISVLWFKRKLGRQNGLWRMLNISGKLCGKQFHIFNFQYGFRKFDTFIDTNFGIQQYTSNKFYINFIFPLSKSCHSFISLQTLSSLSSNYKYRSWVTQSFSVIVSGFCYGWFFVSKLASTFKVNIVIEEILFH